MKLHLGSGGMVKDGFLNTDFDKLDGVDMALDASNVPYPFEDNELEEVFSAHMIEHINHDLVPAMVHEWFRVLKPGGVAIVECPDLEGGMAQWRRGEYADALKLFYGLNERPTQRHLWGYTFKTLAPYFKEAGFSSVHQEESADYHLINFGIPTFRLVATK